MRTDSPEVDMGGDGNARTFQQGKVMTDLCLRECVSLDVGKRRTGRQMVISGNCESLMQ